MFKVEGDSTVKDTYGSSRGPKFEPQHRNQMTRNPRNSTSRDSTLLYSLGTGIHMHTDIPTYTYVHN